MRGDVLKLLQKAKGSFQQDLRDKILSYLHDCNPLEEMLSKVEREQHFICFWVTSKHQKKKSQVAKMLF